MINVSTRRAEFSLTQRSKEQRRQSQHENGGTKPRSAPVSHWPPVSHWLPIRPPKCNAQSEVLIRAELTNIITWLRGPQPVNKAKRFSGPSQDQQVGDIPSGCNSSLTHCLTSESIPLPRLGMVGGARGQGVPSTQEALYASEMVLLSLSEPKSVFSGNVGFSFSFPEATPPSFTLWPPANLPC